MMNNNDRNSQNRPGGNGKMPEKTPPSRGQRSIVLIIYLILFAGICYMWWQTSKSSDPVKEEWSDVRNQITAGDIEKITYTRNQNRGEVTLRKDSLSKYTGKIAEDSPKGSPQFFFLVSQTFDAEKELVDAQDQLPENHRFKVIMVQKENYWSHIFDWIFIGLMILFTFFIMFRPMQGIGGAGGGGIFNVGKSQAKLYEKDNKVNVTFKDVAGLEEAKVEVMEIVDFLKSPQKYTKLGGKIPKGALLVGPPGTGKTLLAKAVAGEANVPFFSLSGSDFVEMFVGVGASRVRDLFKQAKEKAPCIVFIDEIDAVGRARSKNGGFSSNDERENTLNQLLTEMDGFGSNSGVIILAATNRADILDKALLRAGRFDRQINVELPELKERYDIFKVHMKNLKLSPEIDVNFLARQTPGFSGADIANVCNEAALIAARKNKKQIERQDFMDAIDRIVGGLEHRSKVITPEEKNTIAHHEAGHATVSWILPYANPLLKVTIIPRGQSLGAAWYLPDERQLTTKEQMMDEMAATIGGRVAEEMVTGKISTGALSDLEKLTKQAYAMVAYYGMSDEVGNISFYDSTGQSEYQFQKPYSERTSELIDDEVKKLIDRAHMTAQKVLREHREGFEELAQLLLVKEVIYSDDLERIFGKRSEEAVSPTSVKPGEPDTPVPAVTETTTA
jgi:ATP-dependent metalloprotease FtsH